jgi:Fe-S-cluster-containing dehydrogenase component
MKKWALQVDVAKCINCHNCVLATKDEHVGNDFPGYAAAQPRLGAEWISIDRHTRGSGTAVEVTYVPRMCNHCDDAPCIKAATDGAITKREDGIVIIDPVKAKGQKQLVEACPYGHIWWNEELQIPQHWPFDAHLIDQGWLKTRGHQSCPTGAMRAVKLDDAEMARMAREEGLETIKPELGTRSRVYYRNLWRYAKCFIGGTVSTEAKGIVDCVEGARVRLMHGGAVVAETTSDNYGDFKFDRLDENSGAYTIEIEAPGRAKKSVQVMLGASITLGDIRP